jgi:uncharacterized membrane protein (UPF0182 family)
MNDHSNEVTETSINFDQWQTAREARPTYEELEQKLALVTQSLNTKTEALEQQLTYNQRNATRRDNLSAWIVENFEELGDLATELCEMFDLPTTVSHEMTLTISATVTLELPLGYDLDNLSEYDFETSLEYTGDGEMSWSDISVDALESN